VTSPTALARRPLLRIASVAFVAAAAWALAHVGLPARAGDPPPPPPASPLPPTSPAPSASPTPSPTATEAPAFLAPEPAPGALGRLEGVVELAAAGDRVAAILGDGTMRFGTADALVAVPPPAPEGNGWLRVAIPVRGPAVATTRRGHVHRVAADGTTTVLGRIQRGALPAGSRTDDEVVLATEGGALFRVVDDRDGARLVETWPSGSEPATAVDCADGRAVVARTTGAVEYGPLAGPPTRWPALASPVTALALGEGLVALGDARGRLLLVSKDGGTSGEPQPTDVEVTALAMLGPGPGSEEATVRIVVLEGGRRLRLHRATRAGEVGAGGAPLALVPAARGVVVAGADAVWLVGEDGRVRRVALAPAAPARPGGPAR